jgi:hyperosmotically inducible periplasmic protein
MKKSYLLTAIAVAAIAGPAAFAGDGYAKDSPISSAVKSKLTAESVKSYSTIQVDEANGVVNLKGTVDTQAEADRAVALAKQTENVKTVNSEIMVKAPK